VGQAFQSRPPRDSGDFPVAVRNTGLESPVNRQTGMSAPPDTWHVAHRTLIRVPSDAHFRPAGTQAHLLPYVDRVRGITICNRVRDSYSIEPDW